MNLYRNFKKLDIDFGRIGLAPRPKNSDYFCTPRGAKVIGWAGVDGIHYCFLRDFGDMVFAVSPMNCPGEYVHPIARGFDDFLALLLACGDLAAVEQAHGWDQARFDAFLAQNPPEPEQQAILDTIGSSLEIEPIKDAFDYVKSLQADFDYSAIRYKAEFYTMFPDVPKPKWKVSYAGGFWSATGQAGTEIPIGKTFCWGSQLWHIPAAYACKEGLVLDFCVEVEPHLIDTFLEHWLPLAQADMTAAQRRALEAENPMALPHFRCHLTINSRQLREDHSCGVTWIPDSCCPDLIPQSEEAMDALEYYGLDPEKGWIFRRCKFPWATQRRPAIKRIFLTLESLPQSIYGETFPTPEPGHQLTFRHPISGETHTLTVTRTEQARIENHNAFGAHMQIPTHYTSFEFSLDPDLGNHQFSICDTVESDSPRGFSSTPIPNSEAAAIGIIGGADGPTAIFFTRTGEQGPHSAVSSLHFEPAADVKWQMVFHEKLLPDISISLL